jgi:hypothetical protein
MYFPYSPNANLHKEKFGKGSLKARRNTLDTRGDKRTENQSVWRLKPAVQSTCKPALMEL